MIEENFWNPSVDYNPFDIFATWLKEAKRAGEDPANAAAVASADLTGQPSVRIMLLKYIDDNGFIFFTNFNSRKGRDFTENPKAAFDIYWKTLGRQISVRGIIENIDDKLSDEYFHSRPRGSQIASAISKQSSVMPSREDFLKKFDEIDKKYAGKEIPRPPHWHGFIIIPHYIEFFQDAEYRMHYRRAFTREDTSKNIWTSKILYP